MNKWKIAFWFCFVFLLMVESVLVYSVVDQGVTLTYQKESYTETENDLDQIVDIINKTDLTKSQVKDVMKKNTLYDYADFEKDTILLHRISLVFQNDKLKSIFKQ